MAGGQGTLIPLKEKSSLSEVKSQLRNEEESMILNTATEIDLVINKDNSSDDDELFKVDFKRLLAQQMPKKSTSNKVFGIDEGKMLIY